MIKGSYHTEEAKRKISEANKDCITWNKGKKGVQIAWNKGLTKETDERVKKYGEAKIGSHHTEEVKRKMSEARKGKGHYFYGKHLSKEHKEKLSKIHRGEKGSGWKGGIYPFHDNIRHNYIYRQWRDDVLTRDDFTCQECGKRGCYLHAHHRKSFSSILQFYEITTIEEALECSELWNINNGMTLCKDCHRKLHKKVK